MGLHGTRVKLLAGVLAIVACALAACSSSGSGKPNSSGSAKAGSSSASTAGAGGTLKAQLPSQYQNGIDVGITNDTPPLIFQDSSGKNVGMDLDLLNAMSKVLGVPLNINSVPFQDMLLGLQSGKYAFVADTTINNTRKKTFDQLMYLDTSSSFGSLKSTASIGTELTSVCGQTVGVVTGNNTIPEITGEIDQACSQAGKSAVNMKQYPDFNTVYVNMKSGNVKLCFVDTGTYGYFMSQPGGADFTFNGPKNLLPSPSGYSFVKATNSALGLVVQKALKQIIANGSYSQILAKWGQSGVAATSAEMNPATSA